MKLRVLALVLAACLLTGCHSLLERSYSTSEPHSSKFWESEAAGTLRAENYQEVVNDLLLLIGERRENATLRLYDFSGDMSVRDLLERATVEVQKETYMGAYAVSYITVYHEQQKGYYEAQIQIGYRRTLDQIQSIINATSPEALYSLLAATLDAERNELAVRIGYWSEDGREEVREIVQQLRVDRGLEESPGWTINYYPAEGPVGLVEVLLDVPPVEEVLPAEEEGNEQAVGGESMENADEAQSGEEASAKDADAEKATAKK